MRHTTDIRWWLQSLSSCHVYLINDINCPTGVETVIDFDGEDFDTLGEFDTTTGRFYPANDGYYKVCAQVTFLTFAAVTAVNFVVRNNGGTALFWHYDHFGASRTHTIFMSRICHLTAGQYVHVLCSHASGGNVVVRGQQYHTNMWIERSPVIE